MRTTKQTSWLGLASLILAALPGALSAMAPALPRVFSDNMVLQRERPIPLWGRSDAGDEITITLGEAKATTKADADGKWSANLPALPAGGPYTLTIKGKDKNAVTFKNVLIGEVWVCSGQSNMAWPLSRANDAEKEIAAADHAKIRLFSVKLKTASTPLTDVEGGPWQVCRPETAKDFSAVAYFFGRELQDKLDVPIGLINTSWGGTAIEPWTPPVGFTCANNIQQIFDQVDHADRDYAKALATYCDERAEWSRSASKAKLDGPDKLPPAPTLPNHPFDGKGQGLPTVIYNAMVAPIVPYGIAGAIWYQGENNCVRNDGPLYADKMQALVQGWRAVWDQGEFPFYYVQLAPWEYGVKYPGNPDRLPLIWEAQLTSLAIPNTGMAVITDIGNTTDIHPTNKQEVGRRLALWARANTYGEKGLVYSGPLYKSMKIDGNKIRLSFDHVGGGLASRDGKALTHFQIAGDDKQFVDAQAVIDGDDVVVSSEKVKNPIAVRFGWNELAEPNLMNKEGLPASPFRTDKW